ncbi:DUF4279 domain-containing protein [Paenibacillus daejeonensis]|uniref:DUF4279 domain-containing protein n=1 Tax=Paenibacillus daejeonensis TaxID=135193 RepID=UPI00036B774D|nr:DUF4279 domain-containing protein [Paenibacillus daejeonensis]
MDKTKVKVEFGLYGKSFNTQEITRILGLTPSRYWNKGDHIRGNIHNKETYWEISTDYEESYDINDQMHKIVSQLIGKEDQINSIQRNYNVECKFDVVIHIENNEKPAMYLERDRIKFLNEINATIDFDLYIYS